ncbi:MAG TPA: PfkB family carbohydrate kinase [Dermatophilaceae bacterium]|nr:PfkB family carbohydrate kinase [Dermatophilaceae bacterium]
MMGVVCVGIAVLDVVQRVAVQPRWGVKSVATGVEVAAGGPATNAAVTAAALGGSATLVTALGHSPQADLVREDLTRHRVRVLDCAPPGWQLPVSTCIVDDRGERTVVAVGATDSPVEVTDEAREAIRAAGGLLVDGHHPRAGSAALDLRPPGCPAVLDAGSAKPLVEGWLSRLDVVAGSADYAAGLGLDLTGALSHVLAAGAGAGVMTDGANPVVWAVRDDLADASADACTDASAEPIVRTVSPPSVTVRDTLGAGDAFHGALVAALVRGQSLADAVATACAVASTRVGRAGARGWLADLVLLV